MSILKLHRRPEQAPLLAACAASRPAPAERPAAAVAPLPPMSPLPLGAPARAVAVMALLRADDARLGMRRPATPTAPVAPAPKPPLPSRDLIEYQAAVSTAMHVDYERHLDTLRVIDQIAAAAPDPHTLTMALAPVLAQLKGLVA